MKLKHKKKLKDIAILKRQMKDLKERLESNQLKNLRKTLSQLKSEYEENSKVSLRIAKCDCGVRLKFFRHCLQGFPNGFPNMLDRKAIAPDSFFWSASRPRVVAGLRSCYNIVWNLESYINALDEKIRVELMEETLSDE